MPVITRADMARLVLLAELPDAEEVLFLKLGPKLEKFELFPRLPIELRLIIVCVPESDVLFRIPAYGSSI